MITQTPSQFNFNLLPAIFFLCISRGTSCRKTRGFLEAVQTHKRNTILYYTFFIRFLPVVTLLPLLLLGTLCPGTSLDAAPFPSCTPERFNDRSQHIPGQKSSLALSFPAADLLCMAGSEQRSFPAGRGPAGGAGSVPDAPGDAERWQPTGRALSRAPAGSGSCCAAGDGQSLQRESSTGKAMSL